MKSKFLVILAIIIAIVSIKCQKEISNEGNNTFPPNTTDAAPITAPVFGTVTDENGAPAAGARVMVGAATAVTNAQGYFRMNDAALDKNASLIKVEQGGYFTAYRSFKATSGANRVIIQLTKKVLAGTVNTAAGGTVSLPNGSKIMLPQNGVVKANGEPFTGAVAVYAAFIDPSLREMARTLPGSLMADDAGGNRVALSSYGMLAVELQSAAGEKLQVATGKTATLTFAIPSSLTASAPASIPLWYLDETSGIWKEQGEARKSGDKYVGDVPHFSYWNCDMSLPAINFSATIKSSDDVPLAGVQVTIKVVNGQSPADSAGWGSYAHGISDSLGVVSGLLPANKNLLLQVYDECYNLVFTKNIGPFASAVQLGDIVVPASSPSVVKVKGKLVDCNGNPVTKGYAQIAASYNTYYARVNNAGEFSTSFLNCRNNAGELQVTGVDERNAQQSITIRMPVTSPTVDLGITTACGISAVEFIKYKLDNVDYTVGSSSDDSLIAYVRIDSVNGTSTQTLVVSGVAMSTGKSINFSLPCNAATGTYPMAAMSLTGFSQIQLGSPFNVSLTAYPKYIGEFYDGTFSGNFTDGANATHSINASFHIKKRF